MTSPGETATITDALRRLGYHSRMLLFPRQELALHAMPTSCGFQRAARGEYDWHGLLRGPAEFAVFQWTTSGCGCLIWEGRDYRVRPGEAMLVRIPHDHRYRVAPDADHWEFLFVCLNGREAMRIARSLNDRQGPVLVLPGESEAMQAAMAIYRRTLDGSLKSAAGASALAYGLVANLLDRQGDAAARATGRHVTAAAAAHCREHPDSPLKLPEMARLCGLSPPYFCRVFRAEHGMTPAAYRQFHQVRAAVRLLRDTDMALKEIAAACGFADANYFGKVFRRHLNAAPGEFRRSGV